jgi:hypothetical protein
MRHIHQGFLIVSATNSHQDPKNNTALCRSILNSTLGCCYKEVEGCYNGKTEVSFVFGGQHEDLAIKLADLFAQESYLKVQGDNWAELVYNQDKREGIGYFQEYKGNHPEELTAYTLDPDTGIRWIVGPLQGLSAELTSLKTQKRG